MKKIILILLLIHLALQASAQTKDLIRAVQLLKDGKLDSAKLLIDTVAKNEQTKDDPRTWYYRGFIYKEFYKKFEAGDVRSQARLTSLVSFKRSIELDEEQAFKKENFENIKYLGIRFYNDAVKALREGNPEIAVDNYIHSRNALLIANPQTDLTQKDIKFYLGLGTVYMKILDTDQTRQEEWENKTKDAYQKVLDLDEKNPSANYNMGILYYNQAVNIILALDYDVDFMQLETVQDQCVVLFKRSLPYMELAIKTEPYDVNTLTGLAGIYYSLNEFEKSDLLKAKIEELKKHDK